MGVVLLNYQMVATVTKLTSRTFAIPKGLLHYKNMSFDFLLIFLGLFIGTNYLLDPNAIYFYLISLPILYSILLWLFPEINSKPAIHVAAVEVNISPQLAIYVTFINRIPNKAIEYIGGVIFAGFAINAFSFLYYKEGNFSNPYLLIHAIGLFLLLVTPLVLLKLGEKVNITQKQLEQILKRKFKTLHLRNKEISIDNIRIILSSDSNFYQNSKDTIQYTVISLLCFLTALSMILLTRPSLPGINS